MTEQLSKLDEVNELRAILMFVVWKYAHGRAIVTPEDMKATPDMAVCVLTLRPKSLSWNVPQ